MNKKLRSFFLLFSIFVLLVNSFIGCTKNTDSGTLTKLKVSEVTHSVFYAPQYVAIELGFFEEEGIDLELINSQGADKVMTAVLANQVDIGFAGPEAAIYVYNEGKEDYTQVFAQVTQKDGSFLVSRKPIENFEWSMLKGKHILPGRKGGVPYMTLQYVIEQNGLNIETDLDFDSRISYDTMNAAFAGGTGDFVTIFEPTASVFEKEGTGHIVASVGESAGEIPYTAYFSKKSFIEKNPDIVQKFVNAIAKGQKWVAEHSAEEIAEVLAPSFPEVDLDILETVIQRYQEINAWKTEPSMTEESFDKLQDVMIHAGELTTKAPFELIVNNDFAN